MKRLSVCMILFLLLFSVISCATAERTPVALHDSGIVCDAPGLRAEGGVLTIVLPGEYVITGALSNGQIIVDCEMDGKVVLELNGVNIHSEQSPAIYIKQCKPRLTIDLADASSNVLTGGAEFILEKDDEPNGVIFSKDDITITGNGSLSVTSQYMDGIVSKDDLRIKGGNISVSAPRNGIRGKDCVEIFDGAIEIQAGNDGIKSTNKNEPELGFVEISGGSVTVTCAGDPISAITGIRITGGSFTASIIPEK